MAYLWMSAAVPKEDRQAGFRIAEQVLDQLSLPSTAPVQLVVQVRHQLALLPVVSPIFEWPAIALESHVHHPSYRHDSY